MRIRTFGFMAVMIGLLVSGARAQIPGHEVTLRVGDPAPALEVERWVKGGPIERLERGTVYVLEFWATWCTSCISEIPHVTELAKKYRDQGVVVIGLNISETDPDKVEPFVKKMGERMGYAIAVDASIPGDENGKMAHSWMFAAGKQGLPCSFIVDRQGKVAWIGSPTIMERPLKAIAGGTYDAAEQAAFERKVDQMWEEFAKAAQAREFGAALGILERIAATDKAYAPSVALQKFKMLVAKGDFDAANRLSLELAEGLYRNNGRHMTSLAYAMMSSEQVGKLDRHQIVRVAARAAELMAEHEPMAVMVLAQAYAIKGDFRRAAEIQQGVVAKAEEGPQKVQAEKLLRLLRERAGEGG